VYITINDVIVNVPQLIGVTVIFLAIAYAIGLAAYGVLWIVGVVEKVVTTLVRRHAFNKMMAEAVWK
jgi:hypothetical protein